MAKKRFDFAPIPQPSAPARDQALAPSSDGSRALPRARLVPIELLTPDPEQPRKTFAQEPLQELADSLRAQGLRQPITAYYDDSRECFVLISGERRLLAARMAGLSELPVLVERRPSTEGDKLVLQLAENLVREDLTPLEAAGALARLKELRPDDWQEVAARHGFGKRRSWQYLQLLNDPPPLREAVEQGQLSEGHAAEIRRAPEERIPTLVETVRDNRLSVANTRELIARTGKKERGRQVPVAPEEARGGPPTATSRAGRQDGLTAQTGLQAGAVADALAGTQEPPSAPPGDAEAAQPPEAAAVGAHLVRENTRRQRTHRLRQRLERIASELRNLHLEEVAEEYAALPEIIVQARQARESLDAFIALLERIQLDRAGAMEQVPS